MDGRKVDLFFNTQMNTDKKIQMNITDKKIQMNTDKGQALRRSLSRAKSSCSGQAAIELAIFGSLILLALGVFVRYGLNANYSQKLKMDAYGKARAEMNSDAESTIYVVLRDKPMPDPSAPFGVASRDSVFFASESVGRLKGVFDTPEYPSTDGHPSTDKAALFTDPQLPRIIYDINGTIYKFTTAAFKYYKHKQDENHEVKTKVYDDKGWYWKTSGPTRTDSNGVRYENYGSMRPSGSFWDGLRDGDSQGKRADVDGDDEEELILEVEVYGEWDVVIGFYVLDYQEGQINLAYEGPNGQRQGLQSSSTNNLELIDCEILRIEDNDNIKSTTKTSWKQDIIRHIIVNPNYIKGAVPYSTVVGLTLANGDIDGDGQADWYVDVKSDFSENKNLHWSASHAN